MKADLFVFQYHAKDLKKKIFVTRDSFAVLFYKVLSGKSSYVKQGYEFFNAFDLLMVAFPYIFM